MNDTRVNEQAPSQREPTHRGKIAERLDGLGWGLFFIWVGVALLVDLGWGVTLVGIGIITLGEQAARHLFGLKLEGFWLLVGTAFLVGGVWQLVEAQLPFAPIVLILAGLTVLLGHFLPRKWRSHIK